MELGMIEHFRRVGVIAVAGAIAWNGTAMAQESPSEAVEVASQEAQPVEVPRAAVDIIAELNAIVFPEYDAARRNDQAFQAEFMAARAAADRLRIDLIGELLKNHPNDARLKDLLPTRWKAMLSEARNSEVIAEAKSIAGSTDDAALQLDALYAHALAIARESSPTNQRRSTPTERSCLSIQILEKGSELPTRSINTNASAPRLSWRSTMRSRVIRSALPRCAAR